MEQAIYLKQKILKHHNKIRHLEISLTKYAVERDAAIEGAHKYQKKCTLSSVKTIYNRIESKIVEFKDKILIAVNGIKEFQSILDDLARLAFQQAISQYFRCQTCNDKAEKAIILYTKSRIFRCKERFECKFCNILITPC